MRKFAQNSTAYVWIGVGVAIAAAAWSQQATAAAISYSQSCRLEASGDACIYDVTATTAGTVSVCTTASTVGDLWRSTVGRSAASGADSTVGTGSTTACTGLATTTVAAGGKVVVVVTYDRPMTRAFPKTVKLVRITGPEGTVTKRPDEQQEPQTCRQQNERASAAAADTDEPISCGKLYTCKFDSVADTDTFKFDASAGAAVDIKIAGVSWSCWKLYGPTGALIKDNCGESLATLPLTGTYRILAYNYLNYTGTYGLSLQGISKLYSCGIPISGGDQKSGRYDSVADTDTFTLVAKKGSVYDIKITGTSWSCWRLIDPNGLQVKDSCGQATTAALDPGGTYTINAYNYLGYVGDYTLSLQCVAGC